MKEYKGRSQAPFNSNAEMFRQKRLSEISEQNLGILH